MRSILLLTMVLCLASAPLLAAGSDGFAYPNGNLYGNGDWVKGGNTGWIVVDTERVRVDGGNTSTGRDTGNIVIAQGMTGLVAIDFQVMGDGIGGHTTWGVCVDDASQAGFANGNLGKWYGTTNNARGRIKDLGIVTGAYNLTGPGTWDNLRMLFNTNAGTVEYFLNGSSIGVLNNSMPGVALGRISFQQFHNGEAAAAGKSIFIDNISVAAVPEPSSLLALATGIFGMAGFAIRRRK